MRLSNLKKVWKSIFDYYTSVLGLPDAMVQQASQPNLTAIAKDGDTTETLVFARWLAYLATKSSKASEAIGAVMKLDQKAQTLLMDSIQTVRV
jgi:hypothetical protein